MSHSHSSIIDNSETYQTLTRYVGKSELVKMLNDQTFMDSLKVKAKQLLHAINKGDEKDEIFKTENCQLCLILLLRENKITTDDFMTTSLYLELLARSDGEFDIKYCTEGLREFELLANEIAKNYDTVISSEDILSYFRHQSGVGRWLFAVKPTQNPDSDVFMNTLATQSGCAAQDSHWFYVPPQNFIRWLAKKINPETRIESLPIYGSIGKEKLHTDFALKFKRPVSYHSASVKSSLKEAHGRAAMPFALTVHDGVYHRLASSVFETNSYRFMIEKFTSLLSLVEMNSQTQEEKKYIQDIKSRLVDMAVIPMDLLRLPAFEKLTIHLRSSFGIDELRQLYYSLSDDNNKKKTDFLSRMNAICAIVKTAANQASDIQQVYDINVMQLLKEIFSGIEKLDNHLFDKAETKEAKRLLSELVSDIVIIMQKNNITPSSIHLRHELEPLLKNNDQFVTKMNQLLLGFYIPELDEFPSALIDKAAKQYRREYPSVSPQSVFVSTSAESQRSNPTKAVMPQKKK